MHAPTLCPPRLCPPPRRRVCFHWSIQPQRTEKMALRGSSFNFLTRQTARLMCLSYPVASPISTSINGEAKWSSSRVNLSPLVCVCALRHGMLRFHLHDLIDPWTLIVAVGFVFCSYGKPVQLDRARLDAYRRNPRQEVKQLTQELEHILYSLTLNFPDWETMRLIHAARRYCQQDQTASGRGVGNGTDILCL